MKYLVSLFLALLFVTSVSGADWTVEELTERLSAAKAELQKYRAEYEHLKNVGYGGPVLRKDLEMLGGDVASLVKEIQSINEQLSGVEASPLIGEAAVSLKATKEAYDGPPLKGSLESGDIIALQGTVKIPGEAGTMVKSYVAWQLLDANGEQVGDYYKREELWEVGEHQSKVRFLIQDLKSGQYTATLSHIPADHPAKLAQAKVKFTVSTPLFINDAWITDKKGGSKVSTLKPGRKPYFYITFGVDPGIKTVNVQFRAWDTGTGKDLTLEVLDYEVKPDAKEQRTGIMLEEYAIENASGVRFEARMSLADGPPMVVERTISRIKDSYALKLRAAPTILSGQKGDYKIILPDEFEPPYSVRFAGGGLSVTKTGPLRGTFTGKAGSDQRYKLLVSVSDSKGRRAEGAAMVTVKAADEKVLASQRQPTLYDAPPSQPSSPSSYGTSTASSPPASTGSPMDDQYANTGFSRVQSLLRVMIGSHFVLPCAASAVSRHKQAVINHLKKILDNRPELIKLGKMSHTEYKRYERQHVWTQLARTATKLMASQPPNDCFQRSIQHLANQGYISQSEASQAIAANRSGSGRASSGGGGGGGGSGVKAGVDPPKSAQWEILMIACRCYKKGYAWRMANPNEFSFAGHPDWEECRTYKYFGRDAFGLAFSEGERAAKDAVKSGSRSACKCPYDRYENLHITIRGIMGAAWRKQSGQAQ